MKTVLWRVTAAFAFLIAATAPVPAPGGADDFDFEGLEPVEGSSLAMAYIDPKADFSVFERILILDPYVAFRSNWQRDQNRRRRRNISAADMERIRSDVAALFRETFARRLEANDGFEVVDAPGYEVLALRPAIIDLDVSAPDRRAPGRARLLTATTGAATLYIHLVDSVSGDVLGRAADRRVVRSPGGTVAWNNRVTNAAEARRIFGRWADELRRFLDEQHKK